MKSFLQLREASNRTKRNPTRDFLRRYPVSDAEMAKPVKKPEKKKPEQGVVEATVDIADIKKKENISPKDKKTLGKIHDLMARERALQQAKLSKTTKAVKEERESVFKSEIDEASKKPNASSRHLRDYPVSDKDVAKPVKTQKYEMMHRNGQVKRFIANNDAEAKRIAAGLGAKSVIRLKGDVPAGKISEEGVAEAGPFSYGAKPPRKGSVAYNALMKRKEQDKNRVKEIEAIGTKNHHIGVAKVTKAVAEGYTGRETKDGTWRVFKDGQAVAVAGPFNSRDEAHAWIKNHHVGVAKVTKEDIEDVYEAKDDTYKYIDQSGGHQIKGKSGTYVGYTHSATKGKGANILKHNKTKKYYAAGGSSTAFTAKTTLHDTPEDAARAYHKGNLAEEELNSEAYMGKIKPQKSPQQKFKDSMKRAGYDMDAGAKRLQDLLAKHKKEREELESKYKD